MSAIAGALAIAFIIAVGVGGALGSKEYIADNIEDWVENTQESISIEDEEDDDDDNEDGDEDRDRDNDEEGGATTE